MLEYVEPVLDSVGTVLGGCVIIYAINYVLVCMRSVIAMVFGFTKWNRCLMSGLPTDNPLLGFATVKNNPGLHELDQKCQCIVRMKLFEVNDLNYVEINRLMHELVVLT